MCACVSECAQLTLFEQIQSNSVHSVFSWRRTEEEAKIISCKIMVTVMLCTRFLVVTCANTDPTSILRLVFVLLIFHLFFLSVSLYGSFFGANKKWNEWMKSLLRVDIFKKHLFEMRTNSEKWYTYKSIQNNKTHRHTYIYI